jgi:hypothetical protein
MKLKSILAGVIFAGGLVTQAEAILWDLNYDVNPANQATVADFAALGITEDLTGATVSQVIASSFLPMTDGTITLSYLSGSAFGTSDLGPSLNLAVKDYIYKTDEGPIQMLISGLSLAADTTYNLYLIGAGDSPSQGAAFTFNGTTQNTISGTTDPATMTQFTFTTDSSPSDTLLFAWDNVDSNGISALNGFAIAAVPEPATIGLFGLVGFMLFLHHRSVVRKDNDE